MIDSLLKEADLTGIEVIDADTQWLASVRVDIQRQTSSLLHHGLHTADHTDVATALQVYFNMNRLGIEV